MTRHNNEALADRQVDEGQWIHAGAGSNDNVTNLAALSTRDRALWMDGYQWGRVGGLADGHRKGYAACNDEIATFQREAARIVHRLAEIPERDREADKAWRARQEARWSA